MCLLIRLGICSTCLVPRPEVHSALWMLGGDKVVLAQPTYAIAWRRIALVGRDQSPGLHVPVVWRSAFCVKM